MSTRNTEGCFVSLKWQLLVSVIVIIVCIVCIFNFITHQQLIKLKNAQAEYLHTSISYEIGSIFDSDISLANQIANQVTGLISLSVHKSKLSVNRLQSTLNKYWKNNDNNRNFSEIYIFDQSLNYLAFVGDKREFSDLFTRVKQKVNWQIICSGYCYIEIPIKIIVNNQYFVVLVTRKLSDILQKIPNRSELAFAVFDAKENSTDTKQAYGREIYPLNNNQLLNQLVNQITIKRVSLDLNKTHEINTDDGKSWLFWTYTLNNPHSSTLLLIFCDISHWYQTINHFQLSIISILIGSILLAGLLILGLIWKPVTRLVNHANLLPLLAKHKFNEIKKMTPKSPKFIRDEVNDIEVITLDVANQLEGLQKKVVNHTKELERLAMLDVLTGLPNKAMLVHELNKAIACIGRIHQQVVLLFLDLDDFKRVNDTLGHKEGDELLKIVAMRLTQNVRAMDTIFRQGGDEFLILLRGIEDKHEIPKVIHKIFAGLKQPILLKNQKLIITTSIGIAFCQDTNLAAGELIKHAELAMYRAKAAGRSNYRVFDYEMLHQAHNKMLIEQDINQAMAENQLTLYLQPIVSLQNGQLTGFETLIRWFHPQRGLILPSEFIPELAQSDAIILLGNFVLEQGLQLLTRIQQSAKNPSLYISINLSAQHFLDRQLYTDIDKLLKINNLSPDCLLLELTEESVVEQLDKTIPVMQQLERLGVRLAIDDFGVGYSSLSYLKQLPFDVLKIDKSFTQEILNNDVDTHIVNTVIELAHNLGREVIAEGIETHHQETCMKKLNCDLAQGYLYSQPISEIQVLDILTQQTPNQPWPKLGK